MHCRAFDVVLQPAGQDQLGALSGLVVDQIVHICPLGNADFKLEAGEIPGTASLKKTAPDGNVEGFQFRLWCAKGNKTWCGTSDEAGSIYQTNSKFDEENLILTLTVVNTPAFELPATGGLGLLTVPIGIFGLLMCAAFLFLNRKSTLSH